jgi:hypothetical protein
MTIYEFRWRQLVLFGYGLLNPKLTIHDTVVPIHNFTAYLALNPLEVDRHRRPSRRYSKTGTLWMTSKHDTNL